MKITNERVTAIGDFNRAMFAHTLAEKAVFESVCKDGFIGLVPIARVRAATAKINAAIAALKGTTP